MEFEFETVEKQTVPIVPDEATLGLFELKTHLMNFSRDQGYEVAFAPYGKRLKNTPEKRNEYIMKLALKKEKYPKITMKQIEAELMRYIDKPSQGIEVLDNQMAGNVSKPEKEKKERTTKLKM